MDWADRIQQGFWRGWQGAREILLLKEMPPSAGAKVANLAVEMAPVVWLAGKVQSGKTSIVRALTLSTNAEIGKGYRPCTRTASVFDFPADAPVIRFLDTRGLGEAGYDPAEDIAFHEGQAHLMLAVMKAVDPQQDAVLRVVTQARQKHPDWPVIVAQTTLHESYAPRQGHIQPYPYGGDLHGLVTNPAIPSDLIRSLNYQRSLFSRLPGSGPVLFVAVDFTQPDDGYDPSDYGIQALMNALEDAAPAGLVAALKDVNAAAGDRLAAEAHPHIVGYAAAAAAADAVPAAGAVAVPVVQSKMLHALGTIYNVEWDRKRLGEFAACLGAGVMSRIAASFGIRQLAKLIPLYGQTAGAAAASATSFATTFAIGKAACYFLGRKLAGESDPKGVSQAYAAALADAFQVFRERKKNAEAG